MTMVRPAGARLTAAAAGVAAAVTLAACGADTEPQATTSVAQDRPAPASTTAEPAAAAKHAKPRLRPPLAFHVRRRTLLRAKPGGKVVATITTKTEFKSPRIYAVARRKPGWVQVRTAVRGHQLGWLPAKSGLLFSQPRVIEVDLSKRKLTLFHRGKKTNTYTVAIGSATTPTPKGTFAVTDRLHVVPGTPYGCCVLALTARQSKIPQGWGGGDRVAIHATPATWSLGKSVSHGCLRATNKTLRVLFRQVRLGTLVRIHA